MANNPGEWLLTFADRESGCMLLEVDYLQPIAETRCDIAEHESELAMLKRRGRSVHSSHKLEARYLAVTQSLEMFREQEAALVAQLWDAVGDHLAARLAVARGGPINGTTADGVGATIAA